jgi:small-conductance mechanosensitive channel
LESSALVIAQIVPKLDEALEAGRGVLVQIDLTIAEAQKLLPGNWRRYYLASLAELSRNMGFEAKSLHEIFKWAEVSTNVENSYTLLPFDTAKIADTALKFFRAMGLIALLGVILSRSFFRKAKKSLAVRQSANSNVIDFKIKSRFKGSTDQYKIKEGVFKFTNGIIYHNDDYIESDDDNDIGSEKKLQVLGGKIYFNSGALVDKDGEYYYLDNDSLEKVREEDEEEFVFSGDGQRYFFKNGILDIERLVVDEDGSESRETKRIELREGSVEFTTGSLTLNPGFSEVTQKAWIWMILGFSFLLSSKVSTSGLHYLGMVLPGILMVIWGMSSLSWRLRVLAFPELGLKNQKSPLSRFYPPAAFGIFFLFVNFPPGAMTAGWILILACYLVWLKFFRKSQNGSYMSPVEKLSYGASFWFALGSMIVTFAGYARLAILLFLLLFTIVNIATLASALIDLAKKVSDGIFDEDKAPIKRAISLSMAIPLATILSLICAVPWLWALPGVNFILTDVLRQNYKIGAASFELSRFVLIIFLFIFFRSLRYLGQKSLEQLPKSKFFRGLKDNVIAPLKVFYAYVLWTVYVIVALALLGFNFTSLAVVAGGLSVGFGLGLQAICGNLLSGVFLMLSQTIKVGEFVEIDGVLGTVKSINIRATELITLERSSVFIPNYNILSGRYINWTRNKGYARRKISVLMSYKADIQKVIAKLKESIKGVADVRDPAEDEPWAVLEEYGEKSMVFGLYVTITDVKRSVKILSDIRANIKDLMKDDEDTIIYYPTLEITMTDVAEKALGKDRKVPGSFQFEKLNV